MGYSVFLSAGYRAFEKVLTPQPSKQFIKSGAPPLLPSPCCRAGLWVIPGLE